MITLQTLERLRDAKKRASCETQFLHTDSGQNLTISGNGVKYLFYEQEPDNQRYEKCNFEKGSKIIVSLLHDVVKYERKLEMGWKDRSSLNDSKYYCWMVNFNRLLFW